ncbi:MAG: phosphoribosylanthranilate isomerase [Gammaproteobacteria bacterium]|nr:phosphoribosylanthranilate isomerase [Gammaproteobacteria bacterium]MDD2928488.1 phosphoribosylanthranilate isomerase [Sideroxydans sp.]
MTRIKICGITREQDLLAAVAAGADALGFVFYAKSPRNIDTRQAAELLAVLPPFVTSVGLFVDPSADMVREVLAQAPLDVLQFHGDETPEFCRQFGRPYLKAIRVRAGVDLVECAARYADAQGLLLDAYVQGVQGGTGESFDWGLIPQDLSLPVILSGGLHPGNVAAAVQQVRPYAVDVSSGVEAGKGIKDAAKVAAFIKEVKNVDIQLS